MRTQRQKGQDNHALVSLQTLVAKRLATVYAHSVHAPRKRPFVSHSSALAHCKAMAAAPFDCLPRADSGYHSGAAVSQRRKHRTRTNSLLYLRGMEHSLPISF